MWKSFGDPDGTVVVSLADFVSLNQKTPYDQSQGFAPIWGVSNEKSFRIVVMQARKADVVILTQQSDWSAAVTAEMLKSSGVTAQIKRAHITDPRDVKTASDHDVPIDRAKVTSVWVRMVADRIVGDPITRLMRKNGMPEWHPTLHDLIVLRKISEANERDLSGRTERLSVPVAPDVVGAVIRGASSNHPASILKQIDDMFDLGLICARTDAAASRVVAWCSQHLGSTGGEFPTNAVLPTDQFLDLAAVPPTHRDVYIDIWRQAVGCCVESYVRTGKPRALYGSEIESLVGADLEVVRAIGRLRDTGLVFGWTYVMLTDTGMLVDLIIRNGWPDLDFKTLEVAEERLRSDSSCADLLGDLTRVVKKPAQVGLPGVLHLCPRCRGLLAIRLQQRRLRLVCQDPECGSLWVGARYRNVIEIMTTHDSPRWCRKCNVEQHRIEVDTATQQMQQTCKECGRTSTY